MKKKKSDEILTFLGPGSNIDGVLEFKGTIRLDGNVTGKIVSDSGKVIVGDGAVINADIVVESARVMGEVNGTIDARERIEVCAPGRVQGDIYAPVISIDSGATFNGNCGMKARDVIPKKKNGKSKELPPSKANPHE